MNVRQNVVAVILLAMLVSISSCEAKSNMNCTQNDGLAKKRLKDYFISYAENPKLGHWIPGEQRLDQTLLQKIDLTDFVRVPDGVEVEAGWYQASFSVEGIDNVVFSVLISPNCNSDIFFGPPRSQMGVLSEEPALR